MDALQSKGVRQRKTANKRLSTYILIPVLAGIASAFVDAAMAESFLLYCGAVKAIIDKVDTPMPPIMTTPTYPVTPLILLLNLSPECGLAHSPSRLGYSLLHIFTVSFTVSLTILSVTNSVSGLAYAVGRISGGVSRINTGVRERISWLKSKISSIVGCMGIRPKQAKPVNMLTGTKREPIEPEVILLSELAKRWRDMPGTVFLLDEAQIMAGALPTAIIMRHFNGDPDVTDLEYAVRKKRSVDQILNYIRRRPHLLVLTRGRYLRKNSNAIGIEKSYRPFRTLYEIAYTAVVGVDYKTLILLTHPKIFESLPENVKNKLRKVKVRLDTEAAYQEIKEKLRMASMLEVAQALIPGLVDKILEGKDKLTEFLMDILDQSQDQAVLIAEILTACATGQPIPKEIPRALVLALGIKIK